MPSKRKKLGILSISAVLVLLCLVVISSVYMIETPENSSTLLIINRVDDLLAGDLWEYLTLSDLFPEISNAEIVGLGTTSREHNGEIIFFSDSEKPRCFWANPATN